MKNLKIIERKLESLLCKWRNAVNADNEEVLFNKILKCVNKPVETTNEQPKYLVLEYNYPMAFVKYKKDYIPDGDKENVKFIPIKIGEIEG